MPQRTLRNIIVILLFAVLAFAGCTKPDRSEEANKLRYELRDMMYKTPEKALARIDSAEQAGVFSAATANVIRANVYGQMGQTRLAIYYGEQILNDPELKREGRTYYSALIFLNSLLERNGEYGKVLRLTDEMIADVEGEMKQGGGTSGISDQVALRVKSHALTFKGECEKHLGHPDKAEHYYLEGINLMIDSVKHPSDFWVIDALIYGVLEATDFYLESGMPEKALALVAKGDTALARLARCPDVPDYASKIRHNNITISQAMIYAANAQRDQAETFYQKHRQAEGLTETDIAAEARYLAMTERYDEAIRLFRQADSIYLSKGSAISTTYIKYFMMGQYEALQKAGRRSAHGDACQSKKDEALALGDRMRQLTDSIHVEERRTDVEQEQEIQQRKSEIASRRQSLVIHRIILVAAVLIILLIAYLLWRAYKYNKVLLEKNRRLVAEIEQREQAKAEERASWFARDDLTTEQKLFRRICNLMADQQPYTDETLNRDSLAALLGTNAKYVEQAIRECSHGENVTDFINRHRLEHVARLLKTTNDSIALVGEFSGIPSRATLARLFRNAYGMSCSEYRQAARAEKNSGV